MNVLERLKFDIVPSLVNVLYTNLDFLVVELKVLCSTVITGFLCNLLRFRFSPFEVVFH